MAKEYVVELFLNKDSRYVEVINTSSFTVNNTLGMALAETSGIYPNAWVGAGQDVNYPTNVRQGLFGFIVGHDYSGGYTSGASHANVTFRPVIWNK